MNWTLKKNQLFVPGWGIVKKTEFDQIHVKALIRHAQKRKVDPNVMLKTHLMPVLDTGQLLIDIGTEGPAEGLEKKKRGPRKKKETGE
jgi:hypothetical protein